MAIKDTVTGAGIGEEGRLRRTCGVVGEEEGNHAWIN
jgi:hypothetical protein